MAGLFILLFNRDAMKNGNLFHLMVQKNRTESRPDFEKLEEIKILWWSNDQNRSTHSKAMTVRRIAFVINIPVKLHSIIFQHKWLWILSLTVMSTLLEKKPHDTSRFICITWMHKAHCWLLIAVQVKSILSWEIEENVLRLLFSNLTPWIVSYKWW